MRTILLLLFASQALTFAAPKRGENLLTNPDFEQVTRGTTSGWGPVGKGYVLSRQAPRHGSVAIFCQADTPDNTCGAMQEVSFNPPIKHPFKVSGWSKSENATGDDYCLYMDCWYDDGTNLWGQQKSFDRGTHGWQEIDYIFEPAKPIAKIQFFILFRRCTGRAWFDDVSLSLAPFELTGYKALGGAYGGNSIDFAARLSMPGSWTVSVLRDDREVFAKSGKGSGIDLAWPGTDREGALLPGGLYTVRIAAKDDLRQEELRRDLEVRTGSGAGRGYAAWVESSMNRVLINSLSPASAQPPAARIALAGNEYESFQVALRAAPGRDLKGCTVEPGDLTDKAGHVIPKGNLEWQQVGFVEMKDLFNHPKLPEEAVPGWWPDPLLPVKKFDVPGGTTQAIWFTLFAPPGTPAGEYEGQVKIAVPGSEGTTVPVHATVYGFDLPTTPHIKTAFALMDGYLEKLYGEATPELRRAYGDYVLKHRLNPDDISRTDPPDIEDIAHYNTRGLNAFNVINMVEPRKKGGWVCWSDLKVYTPEFKAALIKRLDPYVSELKRRGLADKAYVYTFDERGKDFYPVMREFFGLIKERYGIPTLTTAQVAQDPAVMKDINVDWNCPLTPSYKYEQAERCRKAGLQVWAYVCCGPNYPYANWLAENPLIEARVIWWQAYQQQMDGMLYWGLNIWHRAHNDTLIDPEKDGPRLKWSITTGGEKDEDWLKRLNGDGELLYAGKNGPLGCIRLENIRDGIEDYEYLWLLAKLEGSVEKARAACLPVTENLTTFTRDSQEVYAQRERIARRIEALSH